MERSSLDSGATATGTPFPVLFWDRRKIEFSLEDLRQPVIVLQLDIRHKLGYIWAVRQNKQNKSSSVALPCFLKNSLGRVFNRKYFQVLALLLKI